MNRSSGSLLSKSLCLFFCLLMLLSPLSALSERYLPSERPVVRVGFFPYPCYFEQDEDGTLSGYGYDFIQRLSNYMDYNFVFVGVDLTLGEQIRMLRLGDLDLLAFMYADTGRQDLLYARKPMGQGGVAFTARADDPRFLSLDLEALNGMRVGVLMGSLQINYVLDYAKKHSLQFGPITTFRSQNAMA